MRVWDRLGEVSTKLHDTLAGIRVIRQHAQEPSEREVFASLCARYREDRKSVV